jgi:lysylphosphatidylglycerol synthetase-like protein (DUF2156 family)
MRPTPMGTTPRGPGPYQGMIGMIRGAFAFGVLVIVLANAVVVLTPRPLQQAVFVEHVVDLDSFGWGRLGTVVVGLLLLLVANALQRGKRHAWLLSVALLAFAIASAMFSRTHRGYMPLAILALVALLALAPLFPARSDPAALRRGYLALGVTVATYIFHGLLLALLRRELAHGVNIVGPASVLLLYILRLVVFLALGYSVVEILRPVLGARRLSHGERERARALIRLHGRQTTAHLALQPEMRYFWSATERAMLAYRLVAGTALVLGDPIGAEEETGPLLLAFLTYCRRQDWALAVYQASPRVQQLCRPWGHRAYKVGEEGVVATASFTTQGKAGAPVRHAISRARRDGVTVRIWQGRQGEAIPEAVFAGMERVSRAWLGAQGGAAQMGFSLGRFPADWSPELLTAVALDAHGEVQAFLTWTPLYAGNGWSLDNIRRVGDTTPGAMELLIAECVEWARVRGYACMSLGLAPLAGLDARLQADLRTVAWPEDTGAAAHAPSWLERSAAFLYSRKLLLANYASLYHFKAKFQPVWEPRYLVVTDQGALPRVAAAMMQAHGYTWWRILKDTGLRALLSPRTLARLVRKPLSPAADRAAGGEREPAQVR